MKPTGDDATPRRDGWFEHRGRWEEVTVGTVIGDTQTRTKRWEIVEVAHGLQVEAFHTLWMRAREQTTGAEFTVKPRFLRSMVTILTQDPADTTTPEITPAADGEAIMLLIEKLGATHLATRDDTTGEITCPDYTYESHIEGGHSPILRGLIEHMRTAHGMKADDDLPLLDAINLHAQGHRLDSTVGKAGFPHRHVPEDMALITGK